MCVCDLALCSHASMSEIIYAFIGVRGTAVIGHVHLTIK